MIQEAFAKYLRNLEKPSKPGERQLKEASVIKYSEHVPAFIKEHLNIDVFSLRSSKKVLELLDLFYANQIVCEINKRGGNMYSAGINHYGRFIAEFSPQSFEEQVDKALQEDQLVRRKRIESSVVTIQKIEVTRVEYKRNPDVVAERLFLAKGICGDCNQNAPFKRKKNNQPYLEVHHIIPLSEDGDDSLENTIALCPNCHRKRHFG